MCKPEVRKCFEKLLGINMIIFAPVTIGLAIANVALTYDAWCTKSGQCSTLTYKLAWSWVSVGIWAPIPLFINGIAAVWIARRPFAHKGWICLLSFINTVAFGPALVVISIIEVAVKFDHGAPSASNVQQYGFIGTGNPSTIAATIQSAVAAFGIEIVICIVGFVLWLHALAILYLNCCCRECLQEEMEQTVHKQKQVVIANPEPANRCGAGGGYCGGPGVYSVSVPVNYQNSRPVYSGYRTNW